MPILYLHIITLLYLPARNRPFDENHGDFTSKHETLRGGNYRGYDVSSNGLGVMCADAEPIPHRLILFVRLRDFVSPKSV